MFYMFAFTLGIYPHRYPDIVHHLIMPNIFFSLGVTTHYGFCIHSPLAGFSLLFRGF